MYERRKFSKFEVLLLTAIILMAAFFVILALRWPAESTAHRDDALMANTALSVARVNSNHGTACVVNDCDGGKECTHQRGKSTVGYFDTRTNTIVGERPAGYNEETRIRLNGKTYRGKRNTLVIEAKAANDGTVTLRWVEGRA